MSRKKRSSSRRSSPLSLIRGAVGQKNAATLANALDAFKTKGAIEKFAMTYAQCATSQQFSSVFPPSRKAISLAKLGVARNLEIATLPREIQWAAVSSYFSKNTLNLFLPLRTTFFERFKSGKFAEAAATLDEINQSCGASLWEVENRIALISIGEGFEAQKKYVAEINADYNRTNIAFMASSVGERNEPRVTATAFEQRLKNRAKSWNINDAQISHIFYRLANTLEPNSTAYAAALAFEGTYSSIDLYETLLDIIRRASEQSFFDEPSAIAALRYLRDVEDQRITSLLTYLENDNNRAEIQELAYQTCFRQGKYEDAVALAALCIKETPWHLDAIITYSKGISLKATRIENLGWFATSISDDLSLYLAGDIRAAEAADSLNKIANNLRHSNISVPLKTFLATRSYLRFDKFERQSKLIQIFEPAADSFEDGYRLRLTLLSDDAGAASLVDESSVEYSVSAEMYRKIYCGDLESALEHAAHLASSDIKYYRVLGQSYHTNLLAKQLLLDAAINESVNALIENPGIIEYTPLLEIIRTRGYRDLKFMGESACLSSAFYIFIEYTERSDKEVALKVAWKNFLRSRGVDRPSNLSPIDGSTFTSSEIFFLREVCRQETMELGGAFSSQADLDKERMAICVKLTSADPDNQPIYDQEIVDLTRRINIEEGVEYLESSRVFVDEIGVQKWARKNLHSQYLRYIDYLTAGLFSSIKELEKGILKIASTSKNRKIDIKNYLDDYDVSADTLLESILRELSQAFLQLPRFGLDAFLSSRIRHGSFVGYVRGPLETKRLVTKRNSETRRYANNDALLDRWQISDERVRKVVNQKLASLSEDIDTLLDETVGRRLHVKSKLHPEGMVEFGAELGAGAFTVKRWLIVLKSTLNKDSTLEQLISYCFQNFFWPSVKYSLDSLAWNIQTEFADQICAKLDHFVRSTEGVLDQTQRRSVNSDVALGKSELRSTLKRVSMWFDLPQSNPQMLSMPLERALEIGLISTKNARPYFNPSVKWRVAPLANVLINGPAIGVINDLAFLLFANISKHSGFEDYHYENDRPQIDVCVGIDHRDYIKVSVVSDIAPTKEIQIVEDGIEIAKQKIKERDFENVSQDRQGTGLVRIAMFVENAESNIEEHLSFGLDLDKRFYVSFNIPKGVIAVEESS